MPEILDVELLDKLDSIQGERFEGDLWRATWAPGDPLMGDFGGGRWSPDNAFEALYTSLERDGALAETYHHLSRAPVFSSSHMQINRIAITLPSVLRLSLAHLQDLGFDDPTSARIDYEKSQPIGAAAHLLEYEGLIVPSARWDCSNLVLFLDRINTDEQLHLIDSHDVNWPAWREASGVR